MTNKEYFPQCNDKRACSCWFCYGGECRILRDTYPEQKPCPFFKPKERDA